MKEIIAKAKSIIDSVENVYMGSIDTNGFPNIKGMQLRKREGMKAFYFSTESRTLRVEQYKKNNHACLYFNNNSDYKGVMLVGTIEILADATSKEMIWRKGDDMYYPQGTTDPHYVVLKFTAISGRIYDHMASHDFTAE